MEKYQVLFYETKTGKEPAKEYISGLSPKVIAKFLKIIELLENNGPDVKMPYSRFLESGIFEIRIIQNNNISRVLYFFTNSRKIVLTNGFTKKTQKTPRKEIEKAKFYKEDYKRRFENE